MGGWRFEGGWCGVCVCVCVCVRLSASLAQQRQFARAARLQHSSPVPPLQPSLLRSSTRFTMEAPHDARVGRFLSHIAAGSHDAMGSGLRGPRRGPLGDDGVLRCVNCDGPRATAWLGLRAATLTPEDRLRGAGASAAALAPTIVAGASCWGGAWGRANAALRVVLARSWEGIKTESRPERSPRAPVWGM